MAAKIPLQRDRLQPYFENVFSSWSALATQDEIKDWATKWTDSYMAGTTELIDGFSDMDAHFWVIKNLLPSLIERKIKELANKP